MDKDFLRLIETVDELIPPSDEKLDDECLICECFCVSAGDIRRTCRDLVDVELLKATYNLGGGCQSCLKRIDSWKDKIF